MIAIIDYGVGNIFSLQSSLQAVGAEAALTSDPSVVRQADKLILPGVGAFADAAAKLRSSGMWDLLLDQCERGKPLLGICLGMQMLFDESLEYGRCKGLGLVPGSVIPIASVAPRGTKIPHIGWNALHLTPGRPSPLFRYIHENDCVYFVHSYFASHCASDTIATTEYGAELTAAVQRKNVCGTQFHPEKSGAVGLSILRGFVEMA